MLVARNVFGLGGGEHDAVRQRALQPGAQARAAVIEAVQDGGDGRTHVVECRLSRLERAEDVDQHDLRVEIAEMVAVEGRHDALAISVIARGHGRER